MIAIERGYPFLLSWGVGLWVAGFFLAGMLIYPYAFIGVYLGPVFLVLGSIGWFRNYRKRNGTFPDPINSFRRTLARYKGFLRWHLAMFEFMFAHLFTFWVVTIHFWVLLTFVGVTLVKRSSAYRAAVERVELDAKTGQGVGRVFYYGFLAGGTFRSEGVSEVTFTVVGERGPKEVHATIPNETGAFTSDCDTVSVSLMPFADGSPLKH